MHYKPQLLLNIARDVYMFGINTVIASFNKHSPVVNGFIGMGELTIAAFNL